MELNRQWTIRNANNVQIYAICMFHTAPQANICARGDNCKFIHYEELHRPSIAEQYMKLSQQIVSGLNQLNATVLAVLVALNTKSCCRATAANQSEDDSKDDLKMDDVEFEHFDDFQNEIGDHLEPEQDGDVDVETVKHTEPDVSDEKGSGSCEDVKDDTGLLSTIIASLSAIKESAMNDESTVESASVENHDAERFIIDEYCEFFGTTPGEAKHSNKQLSRHQIELFKCLWANSKHHLTQVLPPHVLPAKYPEQYLCAHTMSGLPYENGLLCHLKTKKFNELPVRILEFDSVRDRYAVEIMVISDDADRIRQFYVKIENIKFLEPTGIGDAFKDFEMHLQKSNNTELLSKLHADPLDDRLLAAFLNFQLAPVPDLKKQSQESFGWSDVCHFVMTGCESYNIAVDERGAQQIVALLYHVCYLKDFWYIWKKYIIPTTWKWTNWSRFFEGIVYVLSPTD